MSNAAPVFHRFGPVPRSAIRPAVRTRPLAAAPRAQTPAELAVSDTIPDSNVLRDRLRTLVEQVTLTPNDPRVER